jgi:hypothetical protein
MDYKLFKKFPVSAMLMVTKLILFYSEVYFKDMSTSKSLPIREVKAEHIGKFVTVRGECLWYLENIIFILCQQISSQTSHIV